MSTETPASPPDTSTEFVLRTIETMRRVAAEIQRDFPSHPGSARAVSNDADMLEALVNERDALRRGMNDKRDMFAAAALTGLIASKGVKERAMELLNAKDRQRMVADAAFGIADAMCERRISR